MNNLNNIINELNEKLNKKTINHEELSFLASIAVENNLINIVKNIFLFDLNNQFKIRNNVDLYKWSFMYGDNKLNELLEKEMKYKNIEGAIQASISHDNYKGFLYLLKNYEKEVLKEKHFNTALNWNRESRYSFKIMTLYIKNLDKIIDLSNYTLNNLNNIGDYPRYPQIKNEVEIILLKNKLENELQNKTIKKKNIRI